jgi:hypothetical protein
LISNLAINSDLPNEVKFIPCPADVEGKNKLALDGEMKSGWFSYVLKDFHAVIFASVMIWDTEQRSGKPCRCHFYPIRLTVLR